MCVCVCVCACVRACVHACVRVCVCGERWREMGETHTHARARSQTHIGGGERERERERERDGFSFDFSSSSFVKNKRWKVAKAQPRVLPFCAIQSVSVSSRTRPECVGKVQLRHDPTFSCSSLVRSESKWLRAEELKFKAKKCLFCINIDKTTKMKSADENICTFSTVSGQLASSVPLIIACANGSGSLRYNY